MQSYPDFVVSLLGLIFAVIRTKTSRGTTSMCSVDAYMMSATVTTKINLTMSGIKLGMSPMIWLTIKYINKSIA